jgi:hypothetical protein
LGDPWLTVLLSVDRDRFAQALPAATQVGRMITLKRRI